MVKILEFVILFVLRIISKFSFELSYDKPGDIPKRLFNVLFFTSLFKRKGKSLNEISLFFSLINVKVS